MAYPAGVIVRQCTFSDPIDAEDASQEVSRKRAIVACNDKLVHIGTGIPLIPTPQIFTTTFTLPVTDQSGIWGDGEGNSFYAGQGFHTHSYRIDLEYKTDDGNWIHLKTLESLVIDNVAGEVDLDLAFNPDRTSYDG